MIQRLIVKPKNGTLNGSKKMEKPTMTQSAMNNNATTQPPYAAMRRDHLFAPLSQLDRMTSIFTSVVWCKSVGIMSGRRLMWSSNFGEAVRGFFSSELPPLKNPRILCMAAKDYSFTIEFVLYRMGWKL